MFKWFGEYTIETDLSSRDTWDFCMNPSNWNQWIDELESFSLVGEFITASTVIGHTKIRNSPVQVRMLLTDVQPFTCCSIFVKSPLSIFTQTSSFILQPITPSKSLLTVRTSVKSLLVPFMKKYFMKHLQKTGSALTNALLTKANQNTNSL